MIRPFTYEPLSASNIQLNCYLLNIIGPFSYITTGLVMGFGMFYYDYFRRRAIEEVMYSEERKRYHSKLILSCLREIVNGIL